MSAKRLLEIADEFANRNAERGRLASFGLPQGRTDEEMAAEFEEVLDGFISERATKTS